MTRSVSGCNLIGQKQTSNIIALPADCTSGGDEIHCKLAVDGDSLSGRLPSWAPETLLSRRPEFLDRMMIPSQVSPFTPQHNIVFLAGMPDFV